MDDQQNLTRNSGENISIEALGKGCEIYVSKSHTFGTDAILLANFAAPSRKDIAADLGTGCGIIPLLWMRDGKTARTDGLEIAADAVRLAQASADRGGFADKLRFYNGDIRSPFPPLARGRYALVTCNPPYKALGAGLKSRTDAALAARHEALCSLREVIAAAADLLRFGGRFALCQRPERIGEIISLMTEYKIEPKRMRLVCKTVGCAPWLVLVEGRLGGGKGMRVLPNLYMYDGVGTLSADAKAIYGPYDCC